MDKTCCPGCGLVSADKGEVPDRQYHASAACRALYDELSTYSQLRWDEYFIHQTVVDAYAAQHAAGGKPIRTLFALVGLYLAVDKGFTGKQVQRAHTELAQTEKHWPVFDPPGTRATIKVADVVAAAPGAARDKMIRKWAESVWESWQAEHRQIAELTMKYLGI